MSTGSTKSGGRNRSRSNDGDPGKINISGLDQPEDGSAPQMEMWTWQLVSVLVLILAAVVRLYALELNPLHHDEGVNGFFLINLINNGIYKYDPANYHGPTLYYVALLVAKVLKRFGFGLSTYGIRLVPVLFGVATVWLVLLLRRRIGMAGSLTGAALVALSPGAVYMSRYFIHESLFVFFTLGIIVASLRYYDSANPVYLLLASVSAALLFATKETAMISAGVLLIALALSLVYVRLRKDSNAEIRAESRKRQIRRQARPMPPVDSSEGCARFGGPGMVAMWLLAAIMLFVSVYILFYSSFFTYSQGFSDSLKTFEIWAKTGKKEHVHEWFTYLSWLWEEEAALLALGAAGALLALWHARHRFAVFAALWAGGIIAAYSLIPYKTPWLTLNFIIPLAITGGYGVDVMYRRAAGDQEVRALVLALLSAALIFCGYQMVQLNFRHYDDERYVYPYAHTVREVFPLIDQVNRFAASTGMGKQITISITSPDYWPLPWYLREYKHAGYSGRIIVSDERW
ncbi:MAG: TIGR03663 family protein [Acidobacteria bacterium]|nr:TIGR03663 family protein [Acidobacteriota bacterium]